MSIKKEILMNKLKGILGVNDDNIKNMKDLTKLVKEKTGNKDINSIVELKDALKVEYVTKERFNKAKDEVKMLIDKLKGEDTVETKEVKKIGSMLNRIFDRINK